MYSVTTAIITISVPILSEIKAANMRTKTITEYITSQGFGGTGTGVGAKEDIGVGATENVEFASLLTCSRKNKS